MKLTALWKKQAQNGNEYFIGKLGDAYIKVVPVLNKTNPKAPDFNVFLEEPKSKGDRQYNKPQYAQPSQPPSGTYQQPQQPQQPYQPPQQESWDSQF